MLIEGLNPPSGPVELTTSSMMPCFMLSTISRSPLPSCELG